MFVGVAVALIGVGVLIAAFGASPGPSVAIVQSVDAPLIMPGSEYQHVVPSSLQKTASVVYAWSSTRSVKVFLYVAGSCANQTPGYVCPAGPALMSWWDTSGVYSYTAAVVAPWLVIVDNVNGTDVAYNGTLVETYVAPPAFGAGWNVYVLIAGSIVLIGIGAVALFLGLFLRGGVYGPRPPPQGQPDAALLHRSPDNLEDDGWDDDPPPDTHDEDEAD
jgi:hypothetical protein